MQTLRSPGVSSARHPRLPQAWTGPDTAVPVFVGYTATGGVSEAPVSVDSLEAYESLFGGPYADVLVTVNEGNFNPSQDVSVDSRNTRYFMYYAVRNWFASGNERCYVLSVENYQTGIGTHVDHSKFLDAIPKLDTEDPITMVIFPELTEVSPQGTYATKEDNYYAVINAALAHAAEKDDRLVFLDMLRNKANSPGTMTNNAFNGLVGHISATDRSYGTAFYPPLYSAYPIQYTDADIRFTDTGSHPDWEGMTLAQIKADIENNPSSPYKGIVTDAWCEKIYKVVDDISFEMPASLLIVDVQGRSDKFRGLWKSSSGVDWKHFGKPVIVLSPQTISGLVDTEVSGIAVNGIRVVGPPDQEYWSSYTIDAADAAFSQLTTRRQIMFLKKKLRELTADGVSEANDAGTWGLMAAFAEEYLRELWRVGMLKGRTRSEAYTIAVGLGTTMTAQDIIDGKIIMEFGVAPESPGSFITFSITHQI